MKTTLPLTPFATKVLLYLLLIAAPMAEHAAAQPTISFKQLADGLSGPLDIKNAGDGSNRLFIVEQGGLIKIYKKGKILKKPFLDLRNLVGVGQFKGIWSIAFSPDYINNRNFYVLYTDKNGNTALARYKVSKSNPDSALESSAVTILNYPDAGDGLYGDLQFGSDNYLYASLGAGANNGRSQNGQIDFGKMLRIKVDINDPPYYSIPADNPFVNDPDVLDEIWALGLRNAWRWSFDKRNDDMWIADVGQDSVEEIDYRTRQQGLKGSNFGWQCYEGNDPYKPKDCSNKSNYVFPIFQYHHDIPKGGECVIGGYVYHGSAYPALRGYYICVDFVTANAWKIKPDGSGGWNVTFQGNGIPKGIASFGEAENGELFAVSQSHGIFYKVQATSSFASIGSEATAIGATGKNVESYVYPTMVTNGMVMLDLKEMYKSVRLMDMNGHQLMNQELPTGIGTVPLYLPKLSPGMYIIQLQGAKMVQQKIYITK